MLKVFLVEDESVMREGLRDNVPWQQYGYKFVGEASDGEMALPLIRKTQPDVLITDIKMPFMDGLSLSRIVSEEFPNIRIIIISGYDEFEYARQAIQIGVEQYLLKPVTRNTLQKVLAEVGEKIESEQEQNNYNEKYRNELHEYEQFSRRYFFERLLGGQLSVEEVYEQAKELSLEINAPSYNLILFSMQDRRDGEPNGDDNVLLTHEEELLRYILRFPEYMLFRWNINTFGVLIKGETSQISDLCEKCMSAISRILQSAGEGIEWSAACGRPVSRISQLPECYAGVNHLFSYRFINPGIHVLTEDVIEEKSLEAENAGYENIDISKVDPQILNGFLKKGTKEEINDFVDGYLNSLSEAVKSKIFRNYLMLNTRFACLTFAQELGASQEEFLKDCNADPTNDMNIEESSLRNYFISLIDRAITFRDNRSSSQSKRILRRAIEYIDNNYQSDDLSLNDVANAIDVSANYFSAIFSSEMKMTFVEYVTKLRMDMAKKLLRQTEMHSGEIALTVGYKDPHYFSYVFKKTQGVTPREYRNGREE